MWASHGFQSGIKIITSSPNRVFHLSSDGSVYSLMLRQNVGEDWPGHPVLEKVAECHIPQELNDPSVAISDDCRLVSYHHTGGIGVTTVRKVGSSKPLRTAYHTLHGTVLPFIYARYVWVESATNTVEVYAINHDLTLRKVQSASAEMSEYVMEVQYPLDDLAFSEEVFRVTSSGKMTLLPEWTTWMVNEGFDWDEHLVGRTLTGKVAILLGSVMLIYQYDPNMNTIPEFVRDIQLPADLIYSGATDRTWLVASSTFAMIATANGDKQVIILVDVDAGSSLVIPVTGGPLHMDYTVLSGVFKPQDGRTTHLLDECGNASLASALPCLCNFLDPVTMISLGLVSKSIRTITGHDAIWHRLSVRYWGRLPRLMTGVRDWKDFFCRRYVWLKHRSVIAYEDHILYGVKICSFITRSNNAPLTINPDVS